MKQEKEMLLENSNHNVFAYYAFGFESHRQNLLKWQIDLVNELYRKSLYLHQLKQDVNAYHTLIS